MWNSSHSVAISLESGIYHTLRITCLIWNLSHTAHHLPHLESITHCASLASSGIYHTLRITCLIWNLSHTAHHLPHLESITHCASLASSGIYHTLRITCLIWNLSHTAHHLPHLEFITNCASLASSGIYHTLRITCLIWNLSHTAHHLPHLESITHCASLASSGIYHTVRITWPSFAVRLFRVTFNSSGDSVNFVGKAVFTISYACNSEKMLTNSSGNPSEVGIFLSSDKKFTAYKQHTTVKRPAVNITMTDSYSKTRCATGLLTSNLR